MLSVWMNVLQGQCIVSHVSLHFNRFHDYLFYVVEVCREPYENNNHLIAYGRTLSTVNGKKSTSCVYGV